MNVEKLNQYVIIQGLHRLELGNNIFSAMGAIVDELGDTGWASIARRLDCSLMDLADAAMDARDAAKPATPTRAQAEAREARNIHQNREALLKEKQSPQRERQRVKQVAAWKKSIRNRVKQELPPNVTPAEVEELFDDMLGDVMATLFRRHDLKA